MANQSMLIYVGTYTRSLPHVAAKSEGIYLIRMDPGNWRAGTCEQDGWRG